MRGVQLEKHFVSWHPYPCKPYAPPQASRHVESGGQKLQKPNSSVEFSMPSCIVDGSSYRIAGPHAGLRVIDNHNKIAVSRVSM